MAKNSRKIILTGYRATGKSSIGRVLARRLGVDFFDTDAMLVERYGEIRDVVAAHGWPFFRAKEEALLTDLIALSEGVIATGGGAILHEETWGKLAGTGFVVWLTASVATICRRLAEDPVSGGQRPSLTGRAIEEEVKEVLAQREPLYRRGSDLAVPSELMVTEVTDLVMAGLH
ncbi:MAG: shikimate kinase [Proteobacteria bacterium]|nr:shikimate kinase [Pseudomonadota bacterium]MBU1688508.1 shikimate kinase [Pseudomonadota bacterium]